ncbi:MAG: hypothetical protein ACK5OX_06225 [Desertimonas sp.]
MGARHLSALSVIAATSIVTGLSACGDDGSAIGSQGSTLTQIVESTAAPTTVPATTAVVTTTTVYVAPVPGCLDYMNFQIEAGEEQATELWQDELGEDRDALQTYCEDLVEENPARVEAMIEEKRVIDAFLAQVEADQAATTEG